MTNWTRRDLEWQFDAVIRNGWLPKIQSQATRNNFLSTAHILGLGSRETNLKNIRGDKRGGIYHGYGVLQVDIGTDPGYARTWSPQNWEPGLNRGIDIFLGKVEDIQGKVGHEIRFKGRNFHGKQVAQDDLRRVATAAYNCGLWGYYHYSRGEHVDSTTTGHEYSRDVYDRAIVFADLLERHGIESDSLTKEQLLQGKYYRQVPGVVIHAPVVPAMEKPEKLTQTTYGRGDTGDLGEEQPANNPPKDELSGNDDSAPSQGTGLELSQPSGSAPAVGSAGVLSAIDGYGEKYSNIQMTLDKFGVSDPDAVSSKMSVFMVVLNKISGFFFSALAYFTGHWEFIVVAVVLFVLAGYLYNQSRNRVHQSKAGIPEDILRKSLGKPSSPEPVVQNTIIQNT